MFGSSILFPDDFHDTNNVGKVEWGSGGFVAVMSDSWDTLGYSPSGFSVHGISQVRTLEWVVISSSIE